MDEEQRWLTSSKGKTSRPGLWRCCSLAGDLETASPTASRLGCNLLLSLSVLYKWHGWSADVSTAFLQKLPQERQLWLKPPAEALNILGCGPETHVNLVKPVYGQLDAPRRWYLQACQRLKKLNWIQNQMDPCLFTPHHDTAGQDDSYLCGMLCLHVDDMLGAGDRSCTTYLEGEKQLQQAFKFRV